jgi:hypothetical protein
MECRRGGLTVAQLSGVEAVVVVAGPVQIGHPGQVDRTTGGREPATQHAPLGSSLLITNTPGQPSGLIVCCDMTHGRAAEMKKAFMKCMISYRSREDYKER